MTHPNPTPAAKPLMPGAGPYTVTVAVDIPKAKNPVDAVDQLLNSVIREGLQQYVFAVQRGEGTMLYVDGDEVMTLEDLQQRMRERE